MQLFLSRIFREDEFIRRLREDSSNLLEKELIPELTSFADYYGFDIVLARIRRPQGKARFSDLLNTSRKTSSLS